MMVMNYHDGNMEAKAARTDILSQIGSVMSQEMGVSKAYF